MANNQAPSWKNPTPAPGQDDARGFAQGVRAQRQPPDRSGHQRRVDDAQSAAESGLSKGIYQLGEATKASSGKDASFTGQVLFSDSKAVYQLSGKGVVEHPRSAFAELEAKGEKIVDGRTYTVAYANGRGVATNAQAANVARRAPRRKGTVPRCDQRAANWPPFFR